ncbi:MAG: DUF3072 domain-containing protein [Rhodomicrobium sp.]
MCKRASGGRSDGLTTGAQASYLQALCEEADEAFDRNLTRADASKRYGTRPAAATDNNPPPEGAFSSKAIVCAVLQGEGTPHPDFTKFTSLPVSNG